MVSPLQLPHALVSDSSSHVYMINKHHWLNLQLLPGPRTDQLQWREAAVVDGDNWVELPWSAPTVGKGNVRPGAMIQVWLSQCWEGSGTWEKAHRAGGATSPTAHTGPILLCLSEKQEDEPVCLLCFQTGVWHALPGLRFLQGCQDKECQGICKYDFSLPVFFSSSNLVMLVVVVQVCYVDLCLCRIHQYHDQWRMECLEHSDSILWLFF